MRLEYGLSLAAPLAAGLTALLLVACSSDSEEATAGTLEARLQQCARPTLRGADLPGSATPLIRESLSLMAEPACKAALLAEDGTAGVACLQALDAAQAAVRHQQACGPWSGAAVVSQPGIALIRLARAGALRVDGLHAGGSHQEAIELALDLVQLTQDAERGGATILGSLVAHGAFEALRPALERVVAATPPSRRPLVVQELETLLAGEPAASSLLLSEQAWLEGQLRDPSGLTADLGPAHAAALLRDSRRVLESRLRVCDHDSPPADCSAALRAHGSHLAAREVDAAIPLAQLVTVLDRLAVRQHALEGLVEHLLTVPETTAAH